GVRTAARRGARELQGGDWARAADAGEAAALVAARGRRRDARPGSRTGGGLAVEFAGFGRRAGGVGSRPALVIIDMNNGFTDPASPLVCELDDTIEAIRKLLEAARRAEIPVVYTTVSYGDGDKVT